ncbi:hypothetical protein N0V85_008382 [Neurospora sp. IMI 360204]|nr:hypothetical protein N0V85_008382 [Neurospora sp. IMI 360204]
MVRTRRMAAMTGEVNNDEQNSNTNSNEPQPMAIDEKPARTRKAPVKPKGGKPAKQAAAQPPVKEEEQVEGTGHVEQQEAGTSTSNISIAPDDEGKNVNTSEQPLATANRTRPSAKSSTTAGRCVQPKATKPKPKSKSKTKTKTPAVIETPDPFDAPPSPPENPPPADSILAVGLADDEVGYLRQLLRYWISEEKGSRTAAKFFHRLDYTYKKADSLPEALARHDLVLALTLERLSRAIPFELFLCRLDRGYEDIDIDPQQVSPSYVIEDLVDLQGRTYAKFVPVDEKNWTKKTTDHRKPKLLPGYCDAALVLVPRDTVADFLWETIEANGPPTAKYNFSQSPLRTLVENYKTLCSGSTEDHDRYWPIFSNILRRACTWDNEKGLGFMPGEFVEGILKACISAKDWDLFTFAAGFTGFTFRKLPYEPHPFVKWARSEITEARATFQDIQEGLATKLVKRNSTKLSFLLGFANELHESVTCSTEDATRELYLNLAEHILNELHIYKLHSRSAETARVREIIQLRSTKVTQDLNLIKLAIEGVDKADIARFISGLIAEKADTLLMRLTMKLVGDAKRIPLRELTHLWVPFLWLLLDVLEKHQIPLSTPRYQNIFAAIMEVYLLREVGKAPKQIWQPVMRRVSWLWEGISCDFTVDAASGTITVTKRLKPDPTALTQWEAKKNKVKKQIFAKFDQAKLHSILGEEYLWFTGFQLLENVLETEVHDEKELPPPPVRSAPVLGKPVDHFIIGRPDLSTPPFTSLLSLAIKVLNQVKRARSP